MACSFSRTVAPVLLLLCGPALAVHAAPITIQFDALTADATTYVEQGYELRSDAILVAAVDGEPGPSLAASATGQGFELVSLDGRSFDLLAVRVAETNALAGPQVLTLEGEKPGGGSVSTSFTTDGVEGWELFTPGLSFADVRNVRWQANDALNLDALEVASAFEFTRLTTGVRSYVEDGLLLRSTDTLEAVIPANSTTPALAGPALGHTMFLEPVAGGSFSVVGLQALARTAPQSVRVDFVGTREDGTTVSASFATTDTAVVFERFDFPAGFVSLVRLQWSDAPDVLLDAFEVEFAAGLHVNVTGRHAGSATVFNLPGGNGRRLDGALAWSGVVGEAPMVVDASLDAAVTAPDGTPAEGVELAVRSSLGNVVWCTGGDRFDALTDSAGNVSFGGSLRAGRASDPAAGERTEVMVPASAGAKVVYEGRLVASRNDGNLFSIDLVTGIATALCTGTLPGGSTEIEFDPRTRTLWVQPPGLGFVVQAYDLTTCSTVGSPIDNGAAMNGLEFIGEELYGVGIVGSCAASSLYRIDVDAGTTTLVGLTGLQVPIAGLAYHAANGVLYGSTGCTTASGSDLVTVDLATGEALVVGSLGVALGSIAIGPDGALYGVGNNQNGGNFYRIDPVAVTATWIGNTATGGLTGLALVSDRGIDLQFNSADLDGDLDVDLADVGQFSFDLSNFVDGAPAPFRSDFTLDGQLNLQDIGSLGSGVGTNCTTELFVAQVLDGASSSGAGERDEGAAVALDVRRDEEARRAPEFAGVQLRNVPNPFNPATEIHFVLPARGHAELRIYDLAGRRVRTLDAGFCEAGQHAVMWSGRDGRGRGVTSGVYLSRLVVDGQPQDAVIKMLLIE